jgi:outer membrane protein OmpA-like peptidoglycan-associated protein
VGPAGPTGRSGAQGNEGTVGEQGIAGNTTPGGAGSVGATGAAGQQGSAGPKGAQGPAGVVGRWNAYRDIWFDGSASNLPAAEAKTIADVSAYQKENPSLQLGLDGSTGARGYDEEHRDLREQRVRAVREALVQAGVPSDHIKVGAFSDPSQRRDGRVAILFSTAN